MDEIVVRDSSGLTKKENPRIGNIVFDYTEYDAPIHATPIVQENGEIVILTNMRAAARRSRVVLQDLTGKEIKNILSVGYENAEVTKDENNIYIFTSNSSAPQFYIFDAKTYEQKACKPLGKSRIQSVCCDKDNIYTFDMENGQVQTRDKEGNIISSVDIEKNGIISNHNLFVTSTGINFAGIGDLGIDAEYRKQLEEKFGKEFMDLNRRYDNLAYDEETQTTYVASRNLVFVADPQSVKGVMYFPDKSIRGLDIDPVTKSLIISASNWPEAEKYYPLDKGGSLEILPIDMVDKRIQDSMEYLEARQKSERMKKIGHTIVDLCDGNFDAMIYLLGEAKDIGEDILPVLDELTTMKVEPDKIINTAEKIKLKGYREEKNALVNEARGYSEIEALIDKKENEKRIGE